MERAHEQVKCGKCGLWHIWKRKPKKSRRHSEARNEMHLHEKRNLENHSANQNVGLPYTWIYQQIRTEGIAQKEETVTDTKHAGAPPSLPELKAWGNIENHVSMILGKFIKITVDCRGNFGSSMAIAEQISEAVNSHAALAEENALLRKALREIFAAVKEAHCDYDGEWFLYESKEYSELVHAAKRAQQFLAELEVKP